MSTVIGTIKAVIGQAWIVGANGTRRPAIEGEPLVRGEEVMTEQGAVTLTLPDGKNLDLGRASSWSGNSAEPSTQDLAAAQQAIAQGGDPTQILEATAAGMPTATAEEAGDGGGGRQPRSARSYRADPRPNGGVSDFRHRRGFHGTFR